MRLAVFRKVAIRFGILLDAIKLSARFLGYRNSYTAASRAKVNTFRAFDSLKVTYRRFDKSFGVLTGNKYPLAYLKFVAVKLPHAQDILQRLALNSAVGHFLDFCLL